VNQYQRPDFYSTVPRTVEFLRKDPGLWRIVSIHDTELDYLESKLGRMTANSSSLYGIDALNFAPGARPVNISRFFGNSYWMGENSTLKELGIFNVKYLLLPNELPGLAANEKYRDEHRILYENPLWQPRAAIRENFEVVQGIDAIKLRLNSNGFDPSKSVILSESPDFLPGERSEITTKSAVVKVLHYGAHRVSIDTHLPRSGILLLNDLHYSGWRATSNGREITILLTNGFVRGLALGPGRHHVEFTYRPTSFYCGLYLAGATMIILSIWGLIPVGCGVARRWSSRNA
jgi:hypothetical protein